MNSLIKYTYPYHISGSNKKNEELTYTTTWMNLENVILSEEASEKTLYCMIPFICSLQERQIYKNGKQWFT